MIAGATSAQQVVANAMAGSWRPEGEDARVLEGINAVAGTGMRHQPYALP